MSAVLTTPKTTSGGEIITHLINASDSAGLHFNGVAGYVSAGDTTVLDGATRLSVEVIAATSSTTEGDVVSKCRATTALRLYFKADGKIHFRLNNGGPPAPGGGGVNGDATSAGSYNDGNPKHIVATWDALKLRIYVNGNLDGEGDLVGGSFKDVADFLAIGAQVDASASASHFEGIVYRARLWNKALTQPEVTASYENATVPFSDQYGSQTDLVVNGTFAADTNWTKQSGWTIPGGNVAHCATTDDYALYAIASNQTVGKKYRITFEIDNWVSGGVTVDDDYGAGKTLYTEDGTYTEEFISTTDSTRFFGQNSVTSNLDIKNVTVREIGCVADYDLAFANPSPSPNGQSLMVRDRASVADGTSSTAGVEQVTPIEQLNAKAARIGTSAATPADGDLIVSGNIGIGTLTPNVNSGYAGLTLNGTTGGEIDFEDDGVLIGTVYNDANDLKLYAYASKNLSFTAGAVERMRIDSAGKVLVGGTTAIAAFGTHAWAPALQQLGSQGIASVRTETSEWGGALHLASSNGTAASPTAAADDDAAGAVYFEAYDGTDFKNYVGGIECQLDGAVASNDTPGRLVFSTAADGANTLTERLRIDSAGLATFANGITLGAGDGLDGATGTGQALHVRGKRQEVGGALVIQTPGASGASWADTTRMTFNGGAAQGSSSITINEPTTFANGIAFQSATTGTGTGVGYTLDAYEEGTWTPALQFGGSSTGITYNGSLPQPEGSYVKIGKLVSVNFHINLSSKGAQTGVATVGSLPFTVQNLLPATSIQASGVSAYSTVTMTHGVMTFKVQTSDVFGIMQGSTSTQLTDAAFSDISSFRGTCVYLTD